MESDTYAHTHTITDHRTQCTPNKEWMNGCATDRDRYTEREREANGIGKNYLQSHTNKYNHTQIDCF